MANKQTQDIDLGIVRYEYGDATRPQRAVLTIETDKSYRGTVDSSATVMWHGNSMRSHVFGLGGDGDFSVTVNRGPQVRATQKTIDGYHAAIFTALKVEELTVSALKHYADFVRAGIDGFKNTYPKDAQSVAVLALAEVTHAQ